MTDAATSLKLFQNPRVLRNTTYGEAADPLISTAEFEAARAEISTWPDYAPTPLLDLPGLAAECGVAGVRYKDEAGRFGLGSFKALGGPYAIRRLIAERGGEPGELTVACATDGNHGRAVAWGAKQLGCKSVVYIHEHVSVGRERAIAAYGAEVRRVPGTYDDSLRIMQTDAAANGWQVISDTAGKDYGLVQLQIIAAYGVMAEEALMQMPAEAVPTHVIVQGGIGSLCAGVFGRLWDRLGADRPAFIVVEPDKADCLYRSAEAGAPAKVPGKLDTMMACLAAGEVCYPAWRILEGCVDCYIAIPDAAAVRAMRRLAEGGAGDPPVVAGESGCAGVAGLMALAEAGRGGEIGLDSASRVLVIGSEGATDPELYAEIVGKSPAEVVG
ncbi:MAG: diaminopropionate ammonia-lyase [Rhodospirillales bacterium]|jgi:diaminopropionate ammonia-lyase|nr:diaminopropionate ammonia-lyase [Rhodospirillales bacterium]